MSKNKPLKRDKLEIGSIYYCRLSSKEMLIVGVDEVDSIRGGKTILVHAKYFNQVTGGFETTTISDYQMEELY